MKDITLQCFRESFPEFSAIADASVEFWLSFSEDFWREGAWTEKMYPRAVYLLTAHRLAVAYDITETLQSNNMLAVNDTSLVTSRTASTSSLSVANSVSQLTTGDDPLSVDFARTNYGLMLLELLDIFFSPGVLVQSPSVRSSPGVTPDAFFAWP